MASRAAVAAAKRHFQPLCDGVRASKCFLQSREAEFLKPARIYGPPPLSLQQLLPSHKLMKCRLINDYVAPQPYVFETQLVNKLFYENLQPSIEEPKPDIFIRYLNKDNREYFTAHSVKEDGSVTPKYYIYVPSLIKEKGCVFSDASCNGVFHFQNWKGDHHLWNPTTNELKTLPKSLDMLPGVLRKFQLNFGMWYDHRCQDYKVLQVVSNHTEESGIFETVFHFELYSLKSNSWKIIQCKGFSGIGRFSGACINGVFYTQAISLEKEARVILSFDFSTETLSTLPVPPNTRSPYVVHSVFEYNGMLSVLVYSPNETVPSSYELWIMNKEGLWVNECVFSTCGIQSPVCFSKNGGQLYFESMNDELLVFDRATRKLKQLGIYCFSNRIKFHPVFERSFHLNLNGVSNERATAIQQWPVVIPDHELQQPFMGIKPKKAEDKPQQ